MTRRARPWRCKACKATNKVGTRRCSACLTARPKRRRPAHMAALDMDYDWYAALNGGDHCGICMKSREEYGKRFHRDHLHKGDGIARGLLCFRCNAALRNYMTASWLESALFYVRRTATNHSEEKADVQDA